MCKTKKQRAYDNYKRFCKAVFKNDNLTSAEKDRLYGVAENTIGKLDDSDDTDSVSSELLQNWILLELSQSCKEHERRLDAFDKKLDDKFALLVERLDRKRSLQAGEAIAVLFRIVIGLFRRRS